VVSCAVSGAVGCLVLPDVNGGFAGAVIGILVAGGDEVLGGVADEGRDEFVR
jgi:hypothetical protein